MVRRRSPEDLKELSERSGSSRSQGCLEVSGNSPSKGGLEETTGGLGEVSRGAWASRTAQGGFGEVSGMREGGLDEVPWRCVRLDLHILKKYLNSYGSSDISENEADRVLNNVNINIVVDECKNTKASHRTRFSKL